MKRSNRAVVEVFPFLVTGLICALLNASPALLAAEIGEVPLYECVRTDEAPNIDGRLDDPCWKRVMPASGFIRVLKDADKPPSVQTHFKLLYDERCLYVGVRCDEPAPENIKANVMEHDTSAVCGDDCIEMFFHPNPESTDYYQLVSNSKGVCYDGRVFDGSWNADWTAKGSVGKEAWYLECRIELSSFPERQGIWRLNFCREFCSKPKVEYHVWSNTYGAFHSPSRFGHLIFSGPLVTLRRGYLIQAAAFARSTLAKEQALDAQLNEINELRRHVPKRSFGNFDRQLAETRRGRTALEKKYVGHEELTLDEWRLLDRGLAELVGGLEGVYWNIKFYALCHD